MRKFIVPLLVITIIIFTQGCASIVSGTRQTVTIKSNPEGARATFYNKKGESIASKVTPCTVLLKRSGSYTLKVEKPEYAPFETQMTRTINGWYFGNVIFGGLVGIVIVDPITGAMFSFSPREITTELARADSGQPSILVKPASPQTSSNKNASAQNFGRK